MSKNNSMDFAKGLTGVPGGSGAYYQAGRAVRDSMNSGGEPGGAGGDPRRDEDEEAPESEIGAGYTAHGSLKTKGEYQNTKFTASTLNYESLKGYTFTNCVFQGEMFGVNFDGAVLVNCTFSTGHGETMNASFAGASLTRCAFEGGNWMNVRFDNAVLQDCRFSKTELRNAFFHTAELNGCRFDRCSLSNVRIIGNAQAPAKESDPKKDGRSPGMRGCRFIGCELRNVTIDKETLENCRFTDCSGWNVEIIASWLTDVTFQGDVIEYVTQLRECVLDDVQMHASSIRCRSFAGTKGIGANFLSPGAVLERMLEEDWNALDASTQRALSASPAQDGLERGAAEAARWAGSEMDAGAGERSSLLGRVLASLHLRGPRSRGD